MARVGVTKMASYMRGVTASMPYELGIAGGGSAGEHAREKRELEVGEEADNGPWAHLSAKESTVLSGATSIF